MPHRVAAYKHCAMMKLQYTVANALDESLAVLEDQDGSLGKPRRRISILARKQYYKEMNRLESKEKRKSGRSYSLSASPFPTDEASYRSNGIDYNESSVSSGLSIMTDEVAWTATPTKKRASFALEQSAIDENLQVVPEIVSRTLSSTPTISSMYHPKESQFVTCDILDLNRVDVTQVSDTTQQEKSNEDQRGHSKVLSAVEAAGLKEKNRNIIAFQEQQLDFLIEIVGAENLPVGDTRSSDPYVVARFGNQILHTTKHVSKSLDPVFTLRRNAFFLWSVTAKYLFDGADGLTLIVYDFDFGVGGGHEGEERSDERV